MPAFYAHYKFGQMVKNKLPAKYQRLLEDYQDLYEIGLHGPDILFFYHPIIRHPITQIGVVIHHETGRVFFEHALTQMHRSAAEGDKMQKALWAYALGVVCHFALDASCHTYINHFEKTRRISHHEIEKEFEKYLMKKDGLDPFNWDFKQALSTNFRWAKPIALFYGLQPVQIHQSTALKSPYAFVRFSILISILTSICCQRSFYLQFSCHMHVFLLSRL